MSEKNSTFAKIDLINAKIKELGKARYPYTIFATKNQPKFGVSLLEASEKQVLEIVQYIKNKKEKVESAQQDELALTLGIETKTSEVDEFTFMDFTLEEIIEDAKLRITQLQNEAKIVKLEESATRLENDFITDEERKEQFMSNLEDLLS